MTLPDLSRSVALPAPANEIIITRVLHAPRHLVWQAMTNPEHVVQWWGPIGFSTITEKHEFRVGGIWKHVMVGPDGTRYPNKSIFTDIREHELIAYSHGGAKEGEQGVSFEAFWIFEEINAWTTRLTLRSVFPSAADRTRVIEQYGALEGGKQTLARLSKFLDEFPASRQSPDKPLSVSLQIKRRFGFSAEQVFDAWLDPYHASQWLFATPNGKMLRVEIHSHVGGRFVIVEERAGVASYHTGEYLEIVRPTRLVFSFGMDDTLTDAGRVQIDIEPIVGGCEVTLTHEMAGKFAEYRERTEQGWAGILSGLQKILAG